MSLGVPTAKAPTGSEFLAPVERVIEAVKASGCMVTVLAHPVPAVHSGRTRGAVLAEVRAVQLAAHAETIPGPLAEQYLKILEQGLHMLTEGAAIGMWRTAVYLTGGEKFAHLAATWQSVYASAENLFEPLTVTPWAEAVNLASKWAMPDLPGWPAPGFYRRPFRQQTLLNSRNLAAFIHFPEQELPGFSVELRPAFDSVRERSGPGRVLRIGTILHRMQKTEQPYTVDVDDLSRHALVCGVTGAGKTTTILWLLRQLGGMNIPYLVVEPVKTEYRILLADQTPSPVRLFTAGNATGLPLRINPFEKPPGIALAVHVDLIRALFTASFDMWSPMPQILERCIHEIYTDRGWNVVTGTNHRSDPADAGRPEAWPTLSDLADKVSEVIDQLGYSGEVVGNLKSGLSARIEGLRAGGKGAMLDVPTGVSAEVLFDQPAVLELESLGADEDRAFVMGLLVLRLVEHRRRQDADGLVARDALQHVLVLEEAHRLLSRSAPTAAGGDAKSKAVDAFVDMLAEIRAYGQGVVIADQVPVRLAPEVLKNTNLKIMQRTVAVTDRTELAAASAMTDDQSQILATIHRGIAAVFSEGDDSPLLVEVGPIPERRGQPQRLSDSEAFRLSRRDPHEALPGPDPATSDAGRVFGQTPRWRAAVSRFATCAAADPLAAVQHRDDLRDLLGPALTGNPDQDAAAVTAAVEEAARWLAHRRGAQSSWAFTDEAAYRAALAAALTGVAQQDRATDAEERVAAFGEVACRLLERRHDPYPSCPLICPSPAGSAALCLYRHAAADLLAGIPSSLPAAIKTAAENWTDPQQGWAAATRSGNTLVGTHAFAHPPGVVAGSAGLCLAQQALAARADLLPHEVRTQTTTLIDIRKGALSP